MESGISEGVMVELCERGIGDGVLEWCEGGIGEGIFLRVWW